MQTAFRTVWRRWGARTSVVTLCLAIGVALAALRLAAPAAVERFELKALDIRFLVRGARVPGDEVVIVGIDEASLAAVGRWPWPRTTLATLVDRMTAAGVAVVGFDAVFDQPDPSIDLRAIRAAVDEAATDPEAAAQLPERVRTQLDSDARFGASLAAAKRIVIGEFFEFGEPRPGESLTATRFPEITVRGRDGVDVSRLLGAARVHTSLQTLARAAAGVGHVNFVPDGDGGFRRIPLALRLGERAAPALSVVVLQRFLGVSTPIVTLGPGNAATLALGEREIPLEPRGDLRIDFAGPPGTFPTISAAAVLDGSVDPERLRNRIALVAPTAVGFDSRPTPFSGSAPGVEIHASVIDDLLHQHLLRRPPRSTALEIAVILGLAAAIGGLLRLHVATGAAGALLLGSGYLAFTQHLFANRGFVMDAVLPVVTVVVCTLAGTLRQYLAEARDRRLVRQAFQQYLDPGVVELVARDPERLKLGGERRMVSILFTDIQGFTRIAEALEPEELADLVTHHLDTETEIVFRHAGLVDKYIGDAMMAFWGAPLDQPDHAARACGAALDMVLAHDAARAEQAARGWPPVNVRIGVATGEAVVGNFGSARRFTYTALGDTVNLAARLEGLNKAYGTRVLIAEDTRRAVGDRYVCRPVDRVRVQGKTRPVEVHEVLGRRDDDADGQLTARATAFAVALAAYRSRDWATANAAFAALEATTPGDPLVAEYRTRCAALAAAEPPADWDGVFDAPK